MCAVRVKSLSSIRIEFGDALGHAVEATAGPGPFYLAEKSLRPIRRMSPPVVPFRGGKTEIVVLCCTRTQLLKKSGLTGSAAVRHTIYHHPPTM